MKKLPRVTARVLLGVLRASYQSSVRSTVTMSLIRFQLIQVIPLFPNHCPLFEIRTTSSTINDAFFLFEQQNINYE